MKTEEYGIMFNVEDRHWWYVSLRELLARMWGQYLPAKVGRVLDAGCGTGAVLDWIARDAGKAGSPAGIDASDVAIAFCRQRGHQCTSIASLEDLPFPCETFDAAVSFDVLCNAGVRDKGGALREVQRVLRPGGLFFLNLPAYPWLMSSHDAAVLNDRRFTRGEVQDMLQENGFEVIRATYWNTLLFPAILLVRFLRRGDSSRASDTDTNVDGIGNRLFTAILRVERALLGLMSFPCGLSIFVVARKRRGGAGL